MGPQWRYVGSPDFHDGHIRTVAQTDGRIDVTVEGDTGKFYIVSFHGVEKVDMSSPQGMMLYALSESETDTGSLLYYDFTNWYCDEPDEPESKAFLRIIAAGFTIVPLAAP
jgi:hypothetical protein